MEHRRFVLYKSVASVKAALAKHDPKGFVSLKRQISRGGSLPVTVLTFGEAARPIEIIVRNKNGQAAFYPLTPTVAQALMTLDDQANLAAEESHWKEIMSRPSPLEIKDIKS